MSSVQTTNYGILTADKLHNRDLGKYLVKYTDAEGKVTWGGSRTWGERAVASLPNFLKDGVLERFLMAIGGPSTQTIEDRRAAMNAFKEALKSLDLDGLYLKQLENQQTITADQAHFLLEDVPYLEPSLNAQLFKPKHLDLKKSIIPNTLNELYHNLTSGQSKLVWEQVQDGTQTATIENSLYKDLHRAAFLFADTDNPEAEPKAVVDQNKGMLEDDIKRKITFAMRELFVAPTVSDEDIDKALKDFSMIVHQGLFADLGLLPRLKLEPNILPVADPLKKDKKIVQYSLSRQENGSILITALNRSPLQAIQHDGQTIDVNPEVSFEQIQFQIKFTPAPLNSDKKPHFEIISSTYERELGALKPDNPTVRAARWKK